MLILFFWYAKEKARATNHVESMPVKTIHTKIIQSLGLELKVHENQSVSKSIKFTDIS